MVTWKQVNNNVLAYYWPRQKHAPNEHLQLRFIVMMSIYYLHISIIYKTQAVRKLFWIIFGLVIGQIIKLPFFYFCAPLLLLVANRYLEPFLLKLVPWNGCPRLTMGEHVKRRSFTTITFHFDSLYTRTNRWYCYLSLISKQDQNVKRSEHIKLHKTWFNRLINYMVIKSGVWNYNSSYK